MNDYTPAIITASVALFAALLSQYLSHYLSRRREKRNEFMLRYQELYSKVIAPLSIYISIKTNPRRLHDVHYHVKESDLLDKSLSTIEDNLKHVSPSLLKVYERYYGYIFFEDGWGSSQEADKHAVIYFLFDDLLRKSRFVGVFNRRDREKLKYLRYHYGILTMCLYYWDIEESAVILSMENFSGVKKRIRYKKFHTVLSINGHNKTGKCILKHLSYAKNDEEVYEKYVSQLENMYSYIKERNSTR
ncbi:hypothetical protein CHH49_04005 [Terribacillus saccharophilus]|uniref:hypothetical protein n=1 Tax=Terribacillus saccharophilus TaxID=361277 RepID=UPI000BA51C3B|nr:hypothetical protein [Terribacillus saccharophilus]PAF22758.1 hypothetical protein CHH49_04005 [Terribacillus saccharophilus]